jgi:hypothetical protein
LKFGKAVASAALQSLRKTQALIGPAKSLERECAQPLCLLGLNYGPGVGRSAMIVPLMGASEWVAL